MPRFMLNDEHWAKLKPLLLQQGIHNKPHLKMTVEGILFRMRVGCPWRDLPIAFEITGGDVHDSKAASILIDQLPLSTAIVGDKGCDSQAIREKIQERGSIAVIPRRKNSKIGNADLDVDLYKLRHLVENAFARLKQFRAIATRYDKLKRNFVGMLALACAFIWLPM